MVDMACTGAISCDDCHRLFVGNLTPNISEDAITRMLSRYGRVESAERHPRFAHVSVVPSDDRAVERCIGALNRSKWCGTELRVERAKEHYMKRLQREWDDENANRTCSIERGNNVHVASSADAVVSSHSDHVFRWKGQRWTFPDEDDSLPAPQWESIMKDVAAPHTERAEKSACIQNSQADAQNEGSCRTLFQQRQSAEEPALNGVTVPNVATSTCDLFGLDSQATNFAEDCVDVDTADSDPSARLSPSPKRAKTLSKKYDEIALAAENDASKIDTTLERELGRHVLATMFAGDSTADNHALRWCDTAGRSNAQSIRRPGLFRTLGADNQRLPGSKGNQTSSRKAMSGKLARKFDRFAGKATRNIADELGVRLSRTVQVWTIPERKRGLFRSISGSVPG